MKTKQEVIQFLESKVGTKVKCVGNESLSGQCVTLIKSLMEFIGVPEPYKARGHAKTAISAYISEGIAKQGTGFLSVFSNKDMGAGYGHIWCNAGDGAGETYESNGQKPLIVTKNIAYTYDAVCNFDSYITSDSLPEASKELAECNIHKSNLQNQVNGLLKDLEAQKGVISDTETKLGTANGRIQELTKQNEDLSQQLGSTNGTIKALTDKVQSLNNVVGEYQKEDAVQISQLKEAYDRETTANTARFLGVKELRAELKLSSTIDNIDDAENEAITAVQSLYQTNVSLQTKVKDLEAQAKKLTTQSKHIDKLSIKEVIIILIDKIKEKYGKK